ncbi:YwqG family protein [Luteimonas aquatica]|uniref:YwqG family protein n=1 Tax=Luteimonas aquatica TaxID=450364 RepID=UPI001F565EB9|nr:DUF1963 domain-containing protein [Luteimonas aquatica]
MKTGTAVLLSTAIVVAVLAALVALGYVGLRHLSARKALADASAPAAGQKADGRTAADAEAARRHARELLAPMLPALEATRRPVLRLAFAPLAAQDDDPLASKLGGRAYWSAERPYPVDAAGRPMVLLAQLDFARLRLDGYPRQGLLQFFLTPHDDLYGAEIDALGKDGMRGLSRQRNFRVVYWPQPSARAAIAPPAAALEANDSLPFDPGKPRRIEGRPESETIGRNDAGLAGVLGAEIDTLIEDYAARHPQVERDALYEAVGDSLERFGSKLGGYPEFTQSDPRSPGDRHVLLLQLDSDDAMMWGDSGVANFFIDPDDLARADFSRVAYHWDCY